MQCNLLFVSIIVEVGCVRGGDTPLASRPTVGGGEDTKKVPRFGRGRIKFVLLLGSNTVIPFPDIETRSDRRRVNLVPEQGGKFGADYTLVENPALSF